MGYTTEFSGYIEVDPPLNDGEIAYINKFAESRRMNRRNGPYYLGTGDYGQDHEDDIIDYNSPPAGQPGLWCQWVASEDGTRIEWDYGEKFYNAAEWMQYIIDHFLGHEPQAKAEGFDFLEGHTLNGTIEAAGEEYGDFWKIVVKDNKVGVVQAHIVYDDEK